MRFIKLNLLVSICMLAVMSRIVTGQSHVWLHVDGKYIKKSPYCTDPNGIWMGCGAAHRNQSQTSVTVQENLAQWMKDHHSNLVRLSINPFVGPYNQPNQASMQVFWDSYLKDVISFYKARQIYMVIDYHVYMHDNPWTGSDGWNGPQWDVDAPSWECQRWLDDWMFIADKCKDEPWVLGYELCNEPIFWTGSYPDDMSWSDDLPFRALCRKNYIKCIQNIRTIDKRHIVLIGNHRWSIDSYMAMTWEYDLPVYERFKPDPPYNQVVFTNNCVRSYGNDSVFADLERIQNTYQVPIMSKEWWNSPPMTQWRQLEQESIELLYGEKDFWKDAPFSDKAYPSAGTPSHLYRTSWMYWWGCGANATDWAQYCNEDIWSYAAQRQASPAPVASGIVPQATQIICSALPKTIFSNGTDLSEISATICDAEGNKIYESNAPVTFSITGGTWEDGTSANRVVNAVLGIAAIKIKATTIGKATVTVHVDGLSDRSMDVTVAGIPIKVTITADRSSLPADGQSTAFITAYIRDISNNVMESIVEGTFNFSVSGPGTLWLDNSTPGNTRTVNVEGGKGGKTYILLKAGTTAGYAVLTGNFGSLTPGSITIPVGIEAEVPEATVWPNPFMPGSGNMMKFTSLPANSTVKIYTMNGKLVRELSASGGGAGEINWDGTNESNERVARGIYLYQITDSNGETTTGKLAVTK